MANAKQKPKEKPEIDPASGKTTKVDEKPEVTDTAPELALVKATPVIMSRMGLEVEHNTTHRINVPQSVTPDQCMDETFYAHVSGRMAIGDTLIIRPDTMEWELVLHVADCGREYAHVIKKQFFALDADRVVRAAANRYTVDFAGSTYKHRALLDGKVLKDGFATKALAMKACENHQMAVDRGVKKQ